MHKAVKSFYPSYYRTVTNKNEMSFCLHLRLLLWKNWILRKRNKVFVPNIRFRKQLAWGNVCWLYWRSIAEILWPLIMIFFVVLLHKIGEKNNFPNCHFKSKAMPTAGGVLFMQTLFCTLNNTCDAEKNASCPCFNSSLISDLGDALQDAFNLTSFENSFHSVKNNHNNRTLKNWIKDILIVESIIEVFKKHKKPKNMETFAEPFLDNLTATKCNHINFSLHDRKYRQSYFNNFLFAQNQKSLESGETSLDLMVLSEAQKKIYFSGLLDSLYELIENKAKINAEKNSILQLKFLDYLFCGPNVPKIMSQVISLMESQKKRNLEIERIEDSDKSNYVVEEPEWENDTTVFCNYLMRRLESTYPTRIMFRLFKPLIRGKVVYTPNAPVINRLMSRINESLSEVKRIIDLINRNINVSLEIDKVRFEDVVDKLKSDDLMLKKIVESAVGKIILENFRNKSESTVDLKPQVKFFLNQLNSLKGAWESDYKLSQNKSNFAKLLPYLQCFDTNRIIPVKNEKIAVEEALYWLNKERLWGLIVFHNVSSESVNLPPSLTYKIRTGIERTPDTNRLQDRLYVPRVRRNIIYDLREITGGFAYLQNMIEGELIREYTKRKYVPGIFLKQMPYPCHVQDSFRFVITRTFPMFMVISWIFIFCMISKRIVVEKEVLFKGSLKVFGVTNTQYWISWFLDAFMPMILVTIIGSILLVEGGLIPNSNIFLIWIFLTAFTIPTITLSFLVSTFFFKSSHAMAVSGLIYFLLYLPYPPIQNFGEALNPNLKILACLISNVAFGLGCTWIANMEETGLGAQLDKMNYSPIPGNPITMWLIIGMFLVDSVLYLLLAIYFDNIFEGKDHVHLPWYYCFTSSYWKKSRKNREINYESRQEKDPRYFEAEPEGFEAGIEILNLSKEFGKGHQKKKVVKNLSINFYENQITSFLGPNGAGKTTTVSMMIGLLPITEGSVRIHGVEIKNGPHKNDIDIGICRQENVLLDDLTVIEHFKLFARLKNRSTPEAEGEIKVLLDNLQLSHRAKQPVKILSEGMKRKVSVAMAFIGGSKTVFLDEPTAGIDPLARRSIWELIVKYKKGRTIVLTTHFLDEADILGDRIAIIASGELQCCGSSIFLKSNFGRGYYLTIESNLKSIKPIRIPKNTEERKVLTDEVEELINYIKNIVPSAEFLEQIGPEIVFILPPPISSDEFNNLFTDLNDNQQKLNIISFGINDTTLEEVCMKILLEAEEKYNFENNKVDKDLKDEAGYSFNETPKPEEENESPSKQIERKTGFYAIKVHFIALLIKRFLHHKRNYKIVLIEIFLPIIFMVIALALARALPKVSEMPPLVIDMSSYGSNSIFYTNEFSENRYISAYEDVLLSPYGLGTKCVLYPEKCSLKNIPKGSLMSLNDTTEASNNCSCSKGFFECVKDKNLKKPPNSKTSEGFVLYNLTGLNWNNWLLTTELEYSPHRFGGMNLGYFSPLTGISIEEFLNLFMFEHFIKFLDNIIIGNGSLIDPGLLTSIIMSISCNSTYGKELFKNRSMVDNVVIWFNNRGRIASLAMMNGVTNLVLRASLPNGTNFSKYSIRLINHPLPITRRQLEDQIELQTNVALVCALSVIWALSFIPAMYAVYVVEENASGLKNLQIVSGLNKAIYWFTNFIWNFLSYSITIAAILLVYFLFHMQAFIGRDTIAAFIVLLYSYGFANIMFIYAISFGFSVPSAAFIFIACWNIFSGVVTLLLTYTLALISSQENSYYLESVFIIFPQFDFGKSLVNMALEGIRRESLKNFGMQTINKSFSWNLTTKYIVAMIANGIFFLFITILIEYGVFQKFMNDNRIKKLLDKSLGQPRVFEPKDEDDDVRKERERIESGNNKSSSDILIINNLTKIYLKQGMIYTTAVDHISVGVKRGECFGLLGLNGAGKTTVFKMLTGCISPSEGDAIIRGFSIKKNQLKNQLLIGYCPQIDALDPYLTVEEHLSFFCRLRGVTGHSKKTEVFSKITMLGLVNQKHKIIKNLSGGNKRKVNTAIALIGNPDVVLLDEPTSGMDILSRRFLWHCLENLLLKGHCILLTSHSMEECQALCTSLSIMVNGRFSCFGSCQHLKSKFNDGYTILTCPFNAENIQDVIDFVQKNFPNSILEHTYYKQLRFKMEPDVFIGTIFNVMNTAKDDRLIQDFSISQTTLENIFLKLTGDIKPPKDPEPHFHCFRGICCTKCKKQPEE